MKFIVSISLLILVACTEDRVVVMPTAYDVIGMTEAELYDKYPETVIPDGSFLLLISKNLHPYHLPSDHVFLQFGDTYTVFELKDGKVIALHQVSG